MTAMLVPFPRFRAFDDNGLPLAFGKLYTYVANSSTPRVTYKDQGGVTQNTNPVILDANGEADVWLLDGLYYKFDLYDANDVQQSGWPIDYISAPAAGATGAAGTTWYEGDGAPSSGLGTDGDYYLDVTTTGSGTGDVYRKSSGAWAVIGNIKGPAGSTLNRIVNGYFYQTLGPWVTSGTDTATHASGETGNQGAAVMFAADSVSVSVTKTGSVSQGFSVQALAGTQTLTFKTACYLEGSAANVSNTGYVKVYFFEATGGTETLLATYDLTASSSTPSWSAQSVDVTANMPTLGDYGLRFELQAISDNTGGSAGAYGTYTGVSDVVLQTSSAGATGPTGPTGPEGPAGASGSTTIVQQVFTASDTWTVPTGVNFAKVTCMGAGGGGGGGATVASGAGGGGGGGGASVRRLIPTTPGAVMTITIGAAGGGSGTTNDGTDGGDTIYGVASSTVITAKGGSGGKGVSSVTGGAGGAAGTGNSIGGITGLGTNAIASSGGVAANLFLLEGMILSGGVGGAGGNGGATGADGSPGAVCDTQAAAAGGAGDAVTKGGGGGGGSSPISVGGAGGAFNSVGSAPASYGAGGGGGGRNAAGGNGGGGWMMIEWVG